MYEDRALAIPPIARILAAHAALAPKPITNLRAADAPSNPAADAVVPPVQDLGDATPKRHPPVGRIGMHARPGRSGRTSPIA